MPRLDPRAWPIAAYAALMTEPGSSRKAADQQPLLSSGRDAIGLWLLKALDLYRDILPPLMYEPELFDFLPPPPVGNEGTPEPTEYHPDWPAVEDLYTAFGRSK